MKKIILLIVIIAEITFANEKLTTLAIINNKTITNIDILNEIQIIKILNKDFNNINFQQAAMTNLINEILQIEEIKKFNINIDENLIKKKYLEFASGLSNPLNEKLEKRIYEKIKIESGWNTLVSKKFSWNLNVNIDEIDEKIKKEDKKFKDKNDEIQYKEKLILIEKNKKFQVYSINYINNLKKNALIKIY